MFTGGYDLACDPLPFSLAAWPVQGAAPERWPCLCAERAHRHDLEDALPEPSGFFVCFFVVRVPCTKKTFRKPPGFGESPVGFVFFVRVPGFWGRLRKRLPTKKHE